MIKNKSFLIWIEPFARSCFTFSTKVSNETNDVNWLAIIDAMRLETNCFVVDFEANHLFSSNEEKKICERIEDIFGSNKNATVPKKAFRKRKEKGAQLTDMLVSGTITRSHWNCSHIILDAYFSLGMCLKMNVCARKYNEFCYGNWRSA